MKSKIIQSFLIVFFIASSISSAERHVKVRILEKYQPVRLELSSKIGPLKIVIYSNNSDQTILHYLENFSINVEDDKILVLWENDKKLGDTLEVSIQKDSHINLQNNKFENRRYAGKLRISVEGSSLKIINELTLNDYLTSVVRSELGSNELEALKAQTVVSRTYTLKNSGNHGKFDFCDLTHCQVYKGARVGSPQALQAVESTKNLVLTYDGNLIEALYHSTCGGITLSSKEVWRHAVPYLVSVNDGNQNGVFCMNSPHFRWRKNIEAKKMFSGLEKRLNSKVSDVVLDGTDQYGFARKITLPSSLVSLSADEFRTVMNRSFGWNTIKSNRFRMTRKNDNYIFEGEGLGHNVGMCQWGARGMARQGYDFLEILKHYYPGSKRLVLLVKWPLSIKLVQ